MASNPRYHLQLPEPFWAWFFGREWIPRVADWMTFRRTHSRAETVREFDHLTIGRLRETECNILERYIREMHGDK